jgi:two-component system LytT family response regulator
MIKAIIVDDEQLAIESLQWEIETFCEVIQVIKTYTDPKKAINGINELKPDLVFLDIEMPEIDGFQLLQKLMYKDFDLIITTAYNQYAIQAFKANAIDYLLKPVDPDDLMQAIDKIKKRKENNTSNKNIETILTKLIKTELSHKKIPLNIGNKIIFVCPEDIIYCKSDGSYTSVYMKNDDQYLVSKNIKHLENLLSEYSFLRVHKSYIVNTKEITELIKQGGGEIVLSNQVIIPVSRSYKHKVFEALHI